MNRRLMQVSSPQLDGCADPNEGKLGGVVDEPDDVGVGCSEEAATPLFAGNTGGAQVTQSVVRRVDSACCRLENPEHPRSIVRPAWQTPPIAIRDAPTIRHIAAEEHPPCRRPRTFFREIRPRSRPKRAACLVVLLHEAAHAGPLDKLIARGVCNPDDLRRTVRRVAAC